jgi:hypothetical protein
MLEAGTEVGSTGEERGIRVTSGIVRDPSQIPRAPWDF